MRSRVLVALAKFAKADGNGAAEVLREFSEYERRLAQFEGIRVEVEKWKLVAEERARALTAETKRRTDVILALGDGWHVLKCGGGVLLSGGEPIRVRDGGEHSSERRRAVIADVRALGFDWLSCEDYDFDNEQVRWTADGETPVKNDTAIPF